MPNWEEVIFLKKIRGKKKEVKDKIHKVQDAVPSVGDIFDTRKYIWSFWIKLLKLHIFGTCSFNNNTGTEFV